MQNQHFSFLFGNPNVRGGGQASWDKILTFAEKLFWMLPLKVLKIYLDCLFWSLGNIFDFAQHVLHKFKETEHI